MNFKCHPCRPFTVRSFFVVDDTTIYGKAVCLYNTWKSTIPVEASQCTTVTEKALT